MRIWFDTEFIENGKTIDLVSIGAVREDGRQFYAEIEEANLDAGCPWFQENVACHLTGWQTPRTSVALSFFNFCGPKPQLWAYYGSYDWVALCQLYGRMVDLPKGWPMWCRDVKQLSEFLGDVKLPKQDGHEHHALHDAVWTRNAHRYLEQLALPTGA